MMSQKLAAGPPSIKRISRLTTVWTSIAQLWPTTTQLGDAASSRLTRGATSVPSNSIDFST